MRRVEVRTPSTLELVDLASLRHDFGLARTFLSSYLESELEGPDASPSAVDAMWIAAVTMYGRAFSNGQRHSGRATTADLSAEDLKVHTYFLDLRNKYVAHAVNAFEEGIVFADLYDPAVSLGIARIGEVHTSLTRLSR